MQPSIPQLEPLIVVDGICYMRPRGASSLVDAVELVKSAITHCREQRIPKLLFNSTGLTGQIGRAHV